MTPIESIYEIQSAVLDLQRYLQSKDIVTCISGIRRSTAVTVTYLLAVE